MPTIHVTVPTQEAGEGVVAYYGEVRVIVDEMTQSLIVMREDHILAEYPPGRYLGWELVDKEPYAVPSEG